MIRSWWARFSKKTAGQQLEADALMVTVKAAGGAAELREMLREHAKQTDFLSAWLPALIATLEANSWPPQEVDKVRAYADFFSGANERGYRRVMDNGLARADYVLFMTACVACYLADRFQEGAQLLDAFHPQDDSRTDWCEYAAFAGYIHVAAGRPIADGVAYFDRALEQGGFSPLLATNSYPIYFEAGRLERCAQVKSLMVEQCGDNPEVIFAYACVELARGYYPEGFRLMEMRYHMPEVSLYINTSLLDRPRWNGQEISGKHLLVHAEQGLGDLLMMARYLSILHEKGIILSMDVRTEAISLMEHNFPYCQFVASNSSKPIGVSFDYWTAIMSLPYLHSTTASSVPAINGYMRAPIDARVYWRERINDMARGYRLRVGLAWSGNPGHRADKRRSIPFEALQSLLRDHGDIAFFSIQTQVPTIHPLNLLNVADELITVADTAALIEGMDLVISVDTSSIHLAGALGACAWLLLPYRYEWRWGLEGPHNAWYASVKVWRQHTNGAWSELLEQVNSALKVFDSANI